VTIAKFKPERVVAHERDPVAINLPLVKPANLKAISISFNTVSNIYYINVQSPNLDLKLGIGSKAIEM
jgi:hypothetical protein